MIHRAVQWKFSAGIFAALLTSASMACVAPPPPSGGSAADVSSDKQIYFGPDFEEGNVTLYRFMAENVSIQTQGDTTMTDTTYTEYVLRLTTDKVYEDGSADFTVTYDAFYTLGDIFFGGKYEYHSETGGGEGTDARITAIWDDLADVTIKFHADPTGEVDPASVKGTENVVKAMGELTATSGRMGEYNGEGLAELYESMWRVGANSMKKTVDEEWTDVVRTPVPGMGTWIFTSDFQWLGATEERVNLAMRMKMELEFAAAENTPEDQLPILESKFETLKGDFRYVWDPQASQLKERRGELEFEWLIVQEGLFEDDIVRTVQHQHVKSSLTRIDE